VRIQRKAKIDLTLTKFEIIKREKNQMESSAVDGAIHSPTCRNGFTIIPPILLWEQSVVILLLKRAYVSRMLDIGKHGGDEWFTWFELSERNSLRPQENMSCITASYSNVGLALGVLGSLPQIQWPPCPFIAQDIIVTWRLGARHVALGWLKPYYNIYGINGYK
jgi:hypothetical protein